MMQCLLGDEMFRDGVKLYLDRHDLQAVTTEDFVKAIEDISGRDLSQFYRWYEQAGRPRLSASGCYDADNKRYELRLQQHGDQPPFHIPVLAGLLNDRGEPLPVSSPEVKTVDGNLLLELTQREQIFRFDNIEAEPVPSLLRGFSAPVSIHTELSKQQLALLWACDSDDYNRWQSGQTLAIGLIRELAASSHAGDALRVDEGFAEAWSRLLADQGTEAGLLAELILLPDEPALSEGLPMIDIDGHFAARNFLAQQLAAHNRDLLLQRYRRLSDNGPYEFSAHAIGRRSLRNRCLELLLADPDEEVLDLCLQQIHSANNMTDQFAAMAALCHVDCAQRERGLQDFYQRWQHQDPVIDKWFNAQALSRMPAAIDAILELEQHPAMDLMNMPRAMAFYGGFFRQNRIAFNEASGRGYDVLAERLILVDGFKPGTTYWLMPQILQWRRFDEGRQVLMKAALEKVQAADISSGLYETVSKALAETP